MRYAPPVAGTCARTRAAAVTAGASSTVSPSPPAPVLASPMRQVASPDHPDARSWSCPLDGRAQQRPQLAPAREEPELHRPHRYAEHIGDLPQIHVVEE